MIGADIEFFIKDRVTGKVIPACGKIGGEKGKPKPISAEYSILEDGAAVELNYTPTDNYAALVERLSGSPRAIADATGYSVAHMPEARIAGLKKYKQAMEIGCVEDFDAYNNPEAPRDIPDIGLFGTYRFAGGHIHMSYPVNKIPPFVVARFMDLHVTCRLLTFVENTFSREEAVKLLGEQRRKFYGLPGLYRPKEYGIEYRTLSNYYTFHRGMCSVLADNLLHLNGVLNKRPASLNGKYMATNWDAVANAIRELDFDQMNAVLLQAGKL